ncbi:MAG: hypothetical protein A2W00_05115 [Candidatus Eisenbacteria bacterium RBG_16_71_46]|nr:MAG: hypothetical protein A2W00_05115 [Candidatus Eisenbacteria bacterium RBG_16_71_46]
MTPSQTAHPSSLVRASWWLAALALLALRLPHLGGPLDDPHAWRQCDTVHYSLDFHRHGIDLLHPAVCWLGGHRTLILEFPLPEAMAALLYRVGGADPMWDRVVALAFFIAAAGYFLAFARLVAGGRAARLATLAYLALPLGQFYSRAAHVDFAATAFAHGLLYHGSRAFRDRSVLHASLAGGAGALGAMIKAPYVFPVLGPLALAALAAPMLSTLLLGVLALGMTSAAFVLWRRHVDAVNAAAPDWSFLPGYYKEVNPAWWYFGSPAQRLVLHDWVRIARRALFAVATPIGALLAVAGLAGPGAAGRRFGPRAYALAWAGSTVLYVLVFFPLNVIHDYYQIPFLAPVALLVGCGMEVLWERLPPLRGVPAGVLVLVLFLGFALWMPVPLGYYRVDWLRVEAGRALARHTRPDELLVAADHASGHSDPRLLLRADREGWSLAIADLTPERLARLEQLGARWVAVITSPGRPERVPPAFLRPARAARVPLSHDGRVLGTLELFRLGGSEAGAAPGAGLPLGPPPLAPAPGSAAPGSAVPGGTAPGSRP